MHKRRQRGMTARDIEDSRWALQRGDWEALEAVDSRMERRAAWDEQHPTGEGSTVERFRRSAKLVEEPCTYQWVRVTNDKGRVLGTFYIRHHNGDISELFLVPARKGVRPNPYDRSYMSQAAWRKDEAEEARERREGMARRAAMTPAEREQHMNAELESARETLEANRQRYGDDPLDLEYYHVEVGGIRRYWDGKEPSRETRPMWPTNNKAVLGATGLSEAHKVNGQRPTLGVQPVTDLDGDVRFRFRAGKDGFTVRGSILGPVLLGYRQAEYQKITLAMIRATIKHMA